MWYSSDMERLAVERCRKLGQITHRRKRKTMQKSLWCVLALIGTSFAAQAATITATIYAGTLGGDGTPDVGAIGPVYLADLNPLGDFSGMWYPIGQNNGFNAVTTFGINVTTTGVQNFMFQASD